MADVITSNETTGGALKNADLLRYSEEIGGVFTPNSTKKHTLQTFKTFYNAGVVVVGNERLTPETVAASADPAYSLGDGTAQTFTSYGKSLGQAQADFPLANVTSVNDLVDWAALSQASQLAANTANQNQMDGGLFGARKYMINKPIPFATTTSKTSDIYVYDMHGSCIESTTTSDIWQSLPPDQTAANSTYISRRIVLKNGKLVGSSGAKGNGQTAIKIGAARFVQLDNLQWTGCDIGCDLMFCLFAKLTACENVNCTSIGFWLHSGLDIAGSAIWTGATSSNSQSNASQLIDCRSVCALLSDYGYLIQDASDILMIGCHSEGTESATQANQADNGIFIDTRNSTVVRGINIISPHIEQSYTDSCIRIKAREGVYTVSDLYSQIQGLYATENRVLVRWDSDAGAVRLKLINLLHTTPFMQLNPTSASNSRLITRDSIYGTTYANAAAMQADAALWASATPTFVDYTPLI